MALTTKELMEKLQQIFDEVTLLEMLNITAEELLERFEDRVEEKFDELEEEVSEVGDPNSVDGWEESE